MKTTLRQIGMILLVSGFCALAANLVHPRQIPWVQDWSRHVEAKARTQSIKVIPFSVALQKFQALESIFVDARQANEFSAGHISGAVSLPFQSLEDHFDVVSQLIDSGKELVVYCKNRECDDSLMLAIELQAMGAEDLVLYVDGFALWEKHDGAVERQAPSRPADGAKYGGTTL